ncbi:MAG: hypothetical protein RIT04_471 [Candidatus Parcubacteria bacterium]|jgi:ribonuclease HI
MKIVIFTDGSSRGNPGPGGWGSVIVVSDQDRVIEIGGGEKPTTNNRMEIMAAIGGIRKVSELFGTIPNGSAITICTDSSYLINGITKWVKGWQAKGWKTSQKEDVSNRDLWEALVEAVDSVKPVSITWTYVGGHIGIAGNERCDVIATGFADTTAPELYDGSLSGYSIKDILNIAIDSSAVRERSAEKSEKNSRSKAKAYSYVSSVDGKVMVHQSWAECESRVKGTRGARFKKALSAGEERVLVAEFSSSK